MEFLGVVSEVQAIRENLLNIDYHQIQGTRAE